MRTLYDGFSFEVIREGETFSDGSFTTRYSEGIQWTNNSGTEGSRYRWIGEGTENVKTRSLYEDGYGAGPVRFTGTSVTLYGKGEAVAVSRSASEGSRGGPAYLGKDLMGSVRSTTNEYGSLEDRYEYDAFGKPYKGDLTQGMNLGYTGKPYDTATGLYNYGYRDYKPEVARFTTVDPVRDGSNWFAYVNNDPVNWVDLWGLTASDKSGGTRSVSAEERQTYIAATGRTMDFDKITITEGRMPTEQEFREAARSVGFDDSGYTKQDIENLASIPDAVSLPDGRIYFKDPAPDIPFVNHELDHQEAYQNGATVRRGGVEVHLTTPLEVFTELVEEAKDNAAGNSPYSNPDMLEYRAWQAEESAHNLLKP
jgi:RHS repeat-associated protein